LADRDARVVRATRSLRGWELIMQSDRPRPDASFQRHDVDALPSRGDCGAFGTIPMLTSLDLPDPSRLDMSKDTSYNDCKRLFLRVKGLI
jgi:hypothetical protein